MVNPITLNHLKNQGKQNTPNHSEELRPEQLLEMRLGACSVEVNQLHQEQKEWINFQAILEGVKNKSQKKGKEETAFVVQRANPESAVLTQNNHLV